MAKRKKNHSKEEMEYDEADLADDEIDDDDDVNVLNNNRRKTDNDNNLSNHSDDRLLINTVDDVIKQQNNTRGWKTKTRKHHSLVIAGLESQFKAMHLDHTMFGDAIDMFSRMCYDYFSLYVNSKVAVHRTFKLIVTYEYPWHAHLQFRVNTAIKISNKKYFNIPREFIISWLHIYEDKLHYWMCNKCDELCQIDLQTYKKTLDESEYYDDYDIDVHNTIESRRDTLYVWMCQNTKWIDDADRYLWYMTKTGNHQIQNLIDKSKGCVLGDMIDYNVVDVQKDIDSYVLRKGKRGASKKPGVFKRISKRLADCVGESSLEEEIINVVRDDGDMVLMRNGGFKAVCDLNRKRIQRNKNIQRRQQQRVLRKLTKKWRLCDFRFGGNVRRNIRIVMIYNVVTVYIHTFLQLKQHDKRQTLIIRCPRNNVGKSAFIEILCQRFNGYPIRTDKGWQGGSYSKEIDFFYIDSAQDEHFSDAGIGEYCLESLAGGQATMLNRRNYPPIKTHRQPLIITTQFKIKQLGYLKDNKIKLDRLMRRAVYVKLK
eukprot:901919_1